MRIIVPWFGQDTEIPSVRRENYKRIFMPYLSEISRLYKWSVIQAPGVSLAQARNSAVRDTYNKVLVFLDADTICPPEQIQTAAELASEKPGQVFAFDTYVRISQRSTFELNRWQECADANSERELYEPHSNGCMAISRESFNELEGYDESFIGWGYEDCDFNTRAHKLWPGRRVSGEAYHLWHGDRREDDSPLDADPNQVAANLRRYQRACAA